MIDYAELPQSVRDYLQHAETVRGQSRKTVDEYALDLRMFFRFMKLYKAGVKEISDLSGVDIADIDAVFLSTITLSDIVTFLSFLARERGDIASTRARKVACLRTFFKYVTLKARLIKENPAQQLESPKLRSSLPIHLSLDESVALLQSVEGAQKERDYAILTLFLNCGLRLSELTGINIPDISEDRLRVVGKGNKERIVYLNPACLSAIHDYLAVRPRDGVPSAHKNALFLSSRKQRISVKTVQWLVKKYIADANLSGKKYSTHKLRHTAATLMFQYGGVDVRTLQEVLGHAQLNTTQIYTHVSSDQLKAATDGNPLSTVTVKKPKTTEET